MKKFVVIFIIVAVVLSGVAAFLQFRRVAFTFDEVDGGARLVRYMGISTEKELTVPAADKNGKTVVALKDFAISNCDYLEKIYIGANITEITEWSITNNRKLQAINVAEENPNYKSIDGVLYNKAGTVLLVYPNSKDLVEVTINKEIILEGTFTVPLEVTEISNNAFYKCKNVAKVIIHDGITRIGDRAFHECDRLRDVIIPEGVKYIGADSYSYNYLMTTELVIPSTVTEIGMYAFFNSQKIPKFVFNGSEEQFKNNVKQGKKWRPIPEGKLWGAITLEFKGAN